MLDKDQRLKRNQKQILTTAVLDGIAILAIAFGIYAKATSANADSATNNDWVNLVLGAGIALAFWCAWRFFTLIRERAMLTSD